MDIRIHNYKIGFTFSGKYREKYIKPIVEGLLKKGFSKEDIFYDEWHDYLINGPHGDTLLRKIYYEQCNCVVVLLSPDYKEKNWTGKIEWTAVKELINNGRDNKICLLSVDSANIGDIDGLFQYQSIAKEIDDLSCDQSVNFIEKFYNSRILPFIKSNEDEKNKIELKDQIATYNILILDDNREQLEIMQEELNNIFKNEIRYDARTYSVTKSTEVIEEASRRDFEVYILDVARGSNHKWQTRAYDYYGIDLYNLLLKEKEDIIQKSKIIIYSRLPKNTVKHEFADANIDYYRKQEISPKQLANIVKDYIDEVFVDTFEK